MSIIVQWAFAGTGTVLVSISHNYRIPGNHIPPMPLCILKGRVIVSSLGVLA